MILVKRIAIVSIGLGCLSLGACQSPCERYVSLFCEASGPTACRDWKENLASERFIQTPDNTACQSLISESEQTARASGETWRKHYEAKRALGVYEPP